MSKLFPVMRLGPYEVVVADSFDAVAAVQWDALIPPNDPFLEHGFLAGLERSGSIGKGTSWMPRPVLVKRGNDVIAAIPLFERDDSYGEFIFDWGFANAALRAGIPYYPKLTAAVPFTPAGEHRLLTLPGVGLADVSEALAAGITRARELVGASSVHVLFSNPREQELLAAQGFLSRLSYQFHWDRLPEWRTSDDHLAAMNARSRKQTRKEREAAHSLGLRIVTKVGAELDERDWNALWAFYRSTAARHGSNTYLTRAFFEHCRVHLTSRVAATLGYRDSDPVAGALFFTKDKALFGRYWGALEELPMLHFELCYYQPLEWALANGVEHVEGGAQGEHKIKRGFVPRHVYSSHWFAHQGFHAAIAEYLPKEERAVRAEMQELWRLSPYRHEPGSVRPREVG